MSRFRVLASVLALAAAAAAAAQDQPPAATFSTAIRTVAVFATVTDGAGRLVPDLRRESFTVLDNGKPQALTLFANDIQPITVVMLLDRSGSMRANFDLVEQAAEAFVGDMLPADKARIGSFSYRIQVDPRDFTSDRDGLVKILRSELQEEGPTPLWNAVNVGITALLHQQGRRVILVFTDGMDEPGNFGNNNSSLKDVMKRAEEEDVMIYAIGLAGQSAPPVTRGGGFHGGFGGGFGGRGGFGGGRRAAGEDKPDPGLAKLAAATGGGYFELTSTVDLTSTFRRVADELHHQYSLGFALTATDGKRHSLEVRLAEPGLTARARRSYVAPRKGG